MAKAANRCYIAATRQNQGKTTISLGLMTALKRRFARLGFIKPVGQRYLEIAGDQIDEDSVLVQSVCKVGTTLSDMSPVAVGRGFTERYIDAPHPDELERKIRHAYDHVAVDRDLVVIEGTGHAGVGSVFDLSNARVARLLDAPAIVVCGGGIGQPTDEVILNKAMFDVEGVPMLGVIVNKVRQDKLEKVDKYVRKALDRLGVRVFGVVPYVPMLANPTVGALLDETSAELVSRATTLLTKEIRRSVIGAMPPHVALDYFTEGTLVITPGTREDIIFAAISSSLTKDDDGKGGIAGVLLTGSIPPHRSVMSLIEKTEIPILRLVTDTYSAASVVHDLMVKIKPTDTKKIRRLQELAEEYIDIDGLADAIIEHAKGGSSE